MDWAYPAVQSLADLEDALERRMVHELEPSQELTKVAEGNLELGPDAMSVLCVHALHQRYEAARGYSGVGLRPQICLELLEAVGERQLQADEGLDVLRLSCLH